MGDITTRTIGPNFDGSSETEQELTIEQQILRGEVVEQDAPSLPPDEEVAIPAQVSAEYFPSTPYIRVDALLTAGAVEGLLLTYEEAVELRSKLDGAISEAESE